MSERRASINVQWGRSAALPEEGSTLAAQLLNIVDVGLIATICGAPFVFGGRHDMGRLVFVALIAATAVAWFVRQSILSEARWNRTAAHGILLSAAALVALQIVPLPASWIAWIAPRTPELLPLWTSATDLPVLGTWTTLSLNPTATTMALAILIAYGLLFVVVVQRIGNINDIRRVLCWIAIAAGLMACFGVVQFFTSNGKFFWFYVHPFRNTENVAMGSFMNRNHFASFLVLGVGPLVAWLVATLRASATGSMCHRPSTLSTHLPIASLVTGLLVVLMGIALSQSRGGALALVAAIAVLGMLYWYWRLVDSKYLFGLAAIALAMLGLLSIYGYEGLAKRLDDFTEGSFEAIDRDSGRRLIWAANLAAIQAGGLTGAGAGSHIDIAPIYLSKSESEHYTHAENGYLQIATETGILGVCLLAAAIGLCCTWCFTCLRNLRTAEEQLCFGAAAAGLAASLVHSLVDFVWYIPATLSVTLVLAACTLRLAQLSADEECRRTYRPTLKRARWWEMTAAVGLLSVWSAYLYFGPAMASIAWDRYLRAEVANSRLANQQRLAMVTGEEETDEQLNNILADSMLRHLEEALYWNPSSATAHFELAQRCLDLFELKQQEAENAMGVAQIADAVARSKFDSPEALRAWIGRALGTNATLLYQAHAHSRRAVELCPLKGEAYVILANLSFLEAGPRPSIEQLADQGLRVRPTQASVLFEIGRQKLMAGELEDALRYWAQCSNDPGPHQLQIVATLAGQFMPASAYVKLFQPDWQTLRQVWTRYRQHGQPQDLVDLATYAQQVTEREVLDDESARPAYLWLCQSEMYRDLQQSDRSLECLEKAYRAGPHVFAVRLATGRALFAAGRYAKAEPHVRWCLGRRPDNKELSKALEEIIKQRYAQRTADVPR